jgi:N-terminal acetyltransferase B complex catalytic subunit
MTTIRRFVLDDLLKFNNVNLDILTETYNLSFYMSYMSNWPESFLVAKGPHSSSSSSATTTTTTTTASPSPPIMGYVLGKTEGEGTLWHGHVSAVTVAPEYRRLGLAQTLMHEFETVCLNADAYFVDLFVRASNHLAINMYQQFGYSTYRRVLGYYSGELPEDALDMRKALPRDVHKQSIIPLDHPVRPEDLEW